jgi:ribosomal protein L35AE/L33A
MATRAKYKKGDKVDFSFAGATETGTIQEIKIEKLNNKQEVTYYITNSRYKYPSVLETKVLKKLW